MNIVQVYIELTRGVKGRVGLGNWMRGRVDRWLSHGDVILDKRLARE